MANEITALEGDGSGKYSLLFLYAIETPRTYDNAAGTPTNPVPTPSADLPALAADILTSAEKAALDGGTSMFEVVSIERAGGLSGAALLSRAQEVYASKKADALARYNATYHTRLGQRFNEA